MFMGMFAPSAYSSGSWASARLVSLIVNGAKRRFPASSSHMRVAWISSAFRSLFAEYWVARSANAPAVNWAAVHSGTGLSVATATLPTWWDHGMRGHIFGLQVSRWGADPRQQQITEGHRCYSVTAVLRRRPRVL